jgi:murein DD-endopeptidase MepM/ murein hydrolase activator NlpD
MPKDHACAVAVALVVTALVGGCTGRPALHSATGPQSAASSGAPSVPAGPPSAAASPSAATSPGSPASPHAVQRAFPVAGRADYGHTHHDYPATDIFAACGSPVRAAADGVVTEVSRVDRFDLAHPLGADKGGLSVTLNGDDGVRYYGSHLSSLAAGIDAGVRVSAGTQLGTVGKTGNSGNACHLHFGLSPQCPGGGDWWVRRGVIFPWKYLDSWRAGGNLSPVEEVASWQRTHGCPTAPPAGER